MTEEKDIEDSRINDIIQYSYNILVLYVRIAKSRLHFILISF